MEVGVPRGWLRNRCPLLNQAALASLVTAALEAVDD